MTETPPIYDDAIRIQKPDYRVSSKEQRHIEQTMFKILDDRQRLFEPLCKEGIKETDSILMTNIHSDGNCIVADGFLVNEEGATYGTGLSYQVNVGELASKAFDAELQTLKKVIYEQPFVYSNLTEKHKRFEEEARKKFEERFMNKATTLHAKWHGYLSNGVQFRPSADQYLPQWDEKEPKSLVVGVNYSIMGSEKTLRPNAEYHLNTDGKDQVIDATSRLIAHYSWDNLTNLVLDGHSMGGNVCWWVAYHENELLDALYDANKGKLQNDKKLRIDYRAKTPVIGGSEIRKNHVKVLENAGLLLRAAARIPPLLTIGNLTPITDQLLKLYIRPERPWESAASKWQAANDFACFKAATLELETTPDITEFIKSAFRTGTIKMNGEEVPHPLVNVVAEQRMSIYEGGSDPILTSDEMTEMAELNLVQRYYQPEELHFFSASANELMRAQQTGNWMTLAEKTRQWFMGKKLPKTRTYIQISKYLHKNDTSVRQIPDVIEGQNAAVYLRDHARHPNKPIRLIDELAFSFIPKDNSETPDLKYAQAVLLSGLQNLGFIVITDADRTIQGLPISTVESEDLEGTPFGRARQLQSWFEQTMTKRISALPHPTQAQASEKAALIELQQMIPVARPPWLDTQLRLQGFSDLLANNLVPSYLSESKYSQRMIKEINSMLGNLPNKSPLETNGLKKFWTTLNIAFPELQLQVDDMFKMEYAGIRLTMSELSDNQPRRWTDNLTLWSRMIRLLAAIHEPKIEYVATADAPSIAEPVTIPSKLPRDILENA